MIQKYLILAGILVGLLGFGIIQHEKAVSRAAEAARSEVKQEYTRTYVEGLEVALKAANELLKTAEVNKERLQNEKDAITKSRDVALARLQLRATRAEAEAKRANDSAAQCTTALSAAELPREDAEFLTMESARADLVLIERDFYYEQYRNAERAVEAHKRAIDRLNGKTPDTKPVP